MDDLAAVWNQCLEHAKGDKFILFCDDDIYERIFWKNSINYVIGIKR